jgi:hypothetical protein
LRVLTEAEVLRLLRPPPAIAPHHDDAPARGVSLIVVSRHLGPPSPPPSKGVRATLERLNEAIIAERGLEPRFSTVAYVRLAPGGEGVAATVSSAGHPAPLLVRAAGRVEPSAGPAPA